MAIFTRLTNNIKTILLFHMALRVLLADESSTIKKVFQLALQDFAVDVRPVNVGTDVVAVARDFQPDLIFADVLLQKRSGYEVSSEIKQHAELHQIPVVLMYSGFMDLDEDKFQASHANAQLEKPFEVAALRKLVTDLVPRTQGQRLSQFLSFPKMPEMQESPPPPPAVASEDFEQVSIPKMRGQTEKYRLDLKPEELSDDHVPVDLNVTDDAVNIDDFLDKDDDDNFSFSQNTNVRSPNNPTAHVPSAKSLANAPRASGEIELEPFVDDQAFRDLAQAAGGPAPAPVRAPVAAAAPVAPAPAPVPQLSVAELERIVRAQSAEIIEGAVWKIVPELAAQIIERELNKLLRERESNPR